MADLFEEIDERLAIAMRYSHWKTQLPWRLLPAKLRQKLFELMYRGKRA